MSGNAGSSHVVEVEPDITAQELNALIATLAGDLTARDGGATIVLPSSRDQDDGRYQFTEPIKIRQHVVLEGEGPGTLLAKAATFDDSEDSAILINAEFGDRRFAVRNLAIDATGVDYGIHFNTPNTPGAQEYADGIYTIENVEIFTPQLDGMYLEGRGQALVRGIRVRDANRHGYVIDAVDSVYDALEAGGCGSAGLVVRGSNNRFANCKVFYSGRVNAAEGHGIWLDGSVSGGQHAVFVNCETQDNEHHGVLVQDFHKVWIQNHISEGNNAGNNVPPDDQEGNAYHICGSSDVKIRGTAVGRTVPGRAFRQKHAIGMEEGAANLKADLISDNNEAGHILNGWHEETDIRINNYDGNRGVKILAISPSFTPNPTRGRKIFVQALVNTPTINNPLATNYAIGNELELVITHGPSPVSVTWGSEFKLGDFTPANAAFKTNVYTFRRYPAAWILVSAMADVDL